MIWWLLTIVVFTTSIQGVLSNRQHSAEKNEIYYNELLNVLNEFLPKINQKYAELTNKHTLANWKYEFDPSEENLLKLSKIDKQIVFLRRSWRTTLNDLPWKELKDEDVRRQILKFINIEELALQKEDYNEFQNIVNKMSEIHSDCVNTRTIVECENEIKSLFPRYVELGNKAAKLNNFKDKSEAWLSKYESNDFQEQLENLWLEIKPHYLQMHAYVRRELRKNYEDVPEDGPIPYHLFEDFDFAPPFPVESHLNVTSAMIEQGYNVSKIFQLAESAFVSMNMSAMPELFWKNSILEKPTDREINCMPSSFDFLDGKDFRIKMCSEIHMDDLYIAHHEMGHIQYFMQYKDLPAIYREGANPGFHEAIGELMALSVMTPAHLQKIKLLQNYTANEEASLNDLYQKAILSIFSFPYFYIISLWRWDVFRGKTTPDQYNNQWWKMVEEYQGVSIPKNITNTGFKPGSIYHIATDNEYIRYFVSIVLQFQFHRALCIKAGKYNPNDPNTKPLHECDITDSKMAGNLLKSMMKLGSSKPWQDALELLTGERKMSSIGILEYFKPFLEWLNAENKKTNEFIGWKK